MESEVEPTDNSRIKYNLHPMILYRVKLSQLEHGQKILQELGLTYSQAKLYVALVRLSSPSTVTALSESSNTARQDVYRILKELQKLGLVEKIVVTPALFKAISTREATSILIERQRAKTLALEKESERLFDKFSQIPDEMLAGSHEFVLIPKGKVLVNRIEKAIRASNHRIHAITPWRVLMQWMINSRELWQKALERGLEVRWITGKETPKIDYDMKIANEIPANSNFKLRAIPDSMGIRMGILDEVEVFIGTSQSENLAGSSAIWTNNSILVEALVECFNSKWAQANE